MEDTSKEDYAEGRRERKRERGKVGHGEKKEERLAETTVGRANGEVQLGGDQDTERSAAPAATLLCLGFIREALHGNAAAE